MLALLSGTVRAGVVLHEGAVPPADLIAPIDVQITSLVGAERIATPSGQLLPAVVRLDVAAAESAERVLNEAFARARAEFGRAVEQAFGSKIIGEDKIESLRFQSFRSEFVAAHPEFPVGYVLAATWARGDDGELVRLRMASVLRQVLTRHLIGELPKAGTVFVLALPQGLLVRSWSEASPAIVRAVDGASVFSPEAARAELWRSLGVGERFAGGFLETLVRPTIHFDERLTALFLHERLGTELPGRFFGRGEPIVRAGQAVDAAAAAALRHLDRLGLAPLTPMPSELPGPSAEVVAEPKSSPETAPSATTNLDVLEPPAPAVETRLSDPIVLRWMLGMVALGVVTLALGAWGYLRLRRLRRSTAALAQAAPAPGPDMRELLAPHLAREMTERGMQALFSQRQELLENTEVASERMAEMETRVAKVQPAIQERMQSYESRIKALERELQKR